MCDDFLSCTKGGLKWWWDHTPPGVLLDKAGEKAKEVAGSAIDNFAQSMADSLQNIMTKTVGWWVYRPSPRLDCQLDAVRSERTEGIPDYSGISCAAAETITDIRDIVFPVTVFIAVAGLMWHGIRMIASRKANPLIDAGSGLFILALVSVMGVAVPNLALQGGDLFASKILKEATNDQFAKKFIELFGNAGAIPAALMIVLGFIGIIVGFIQWVLMFFREAAVIVLAGVIVLAAAGSMFGATSGWLRKVSAWMAALIFYKPIAALVYATAFTMIRNADGVESLMMGLMMLTLSLVALPAMMRLFNWTAGALEQRGGGGVPLSRTLAGAVDQAAAHYHSSGRAAQDQARRIEQGLGPADGSGRRSSGPPTFSGLSGPITPTGGGGGSGATGPSPRPATVGGSTAGGSVTRPVPAPGATAGAGSTGAAATRSAGSTAAGAAGAGAVAGPVGAAVVATGQVAASQVRKGADGAANTMGEPPR